MRGSRLVPAIYHNLLQELCPRNAEPLGHFLTDYLSSEESLEYDILVLGKTCNTHFSFKFNIALLTLLFAHRL